jgi:hypothetical protein
MPDQLQTDPQLLSKVLRTKLGMSWEPRWDTPPMPAEPVTADDSAWHPGHAGVVPAPMPQANMGTQQAARDLANPLVRKQLGLPPLVM